MQDACRESCVQLQEHYMHVQGAREYVVTTRFLHDYRDAYSYIHVCISS